MSGTPYVLYLPEIALEKIFSFLTYDEIAKNRIDVKMSQEDDLLDHLLSAATEELENLNKKGSTLCETDIFKKETNLSEKNLPSISVSNASVIHNGDTDSSDDEGKKNYENQKYNECGREIKHLLENTSSFSTSRYSGKPSSWKTKATFVPPNDPKPMPRKTHETPKPKVDVYTDPIFGLRIINPLISSAVLQERMVGREAVPFAKINRHLQVYGKDKDWVIAGVIASKNAKTSQKGSQFCIWTLTDLKEDIKTVSLFLFSSAHKQLWKTAVGTVVGILNPSVLDKKDGSRDEACLSIDNPQKAMLFGQSKDFGTCKSLKKNGERCTAIVNLNRCEFCVYHIKQEYQKCTKRSELQANFSGRGLTALRNKVLGKNEVFYAGKSYMAIPAKKSKKMQQKDNSRLQSLSAMGISINSNNITKAKNKNGFTKKQNAPRLDVSHAQRLRDIELLKKLGGTVGIESKNSFTGTHSSNVTLEESKKIAANVISNLKAKTNETTSLSKSNKSKDNLIGDDDDDKKNFHGKISNSITFDESKSTALKIITKLKSKTQSCQLPSTSMEEGKQPENVFNNDIFNDSDNTLNYDDTDLCLEINSQKPKKSYRENNVNRASTDVSTLKIDKNKLSGTSINDTHSLARGTNANINSAESRLDNNSSESFSSQNINEPNKGRQTLKHCETNVVSDKSNLSTMGFPVLSGFGTNNTVDLSKPVTPKHINRAKLNAIKFVQRNGPLKKANPNSIKGSGKKRPIEDIEKNENAVKKSKLAQSEFISDRFKKMMAATSNHLDLLEARDDEEKEKYFNKLEIKEKMEEKMVNTFKMACKAVRCLKCKYTNFSASEMCKTERHPLKVFDAMKRFFKCGNCGNRTVSLEIIPLGLCKNCGSGKWERTGMMKEKVAVVAHSLSIRGGEQKFVNSVVLDANINLLVPDSGS